MTYDSWTGTFAKIAQTNGAATRSASFLDDGYGNWKSFTDTAGKVTFGYINSRITTITRPAGGQTKLTYDTSNRVIQIKRVNTSTGFTGELDHRDLLPVGHTDRRRRSKHRPRRRGRLLNSESASQPSAVCTVR